MEQIMIRAVAFQRDGKWIAQCLEYDLCTSARTQNELARRLAAQLRLQLALDRARGAEPFQDLPRAPQRFWDMYLSSAPGREFQVRSSWLGSLFRTWWHKPRVQAKLTLATA